jgi:HTH-type transcriptional regulator / antitoxin HigA
VVEPIRLTTPEQREEILRNAHLNPSQIPAEDIFIDLLTVDRLSDRGNSRTADETEYLLLLAVFVEKYEKEHHPIPPVSSVDILRYLIETHHKTQREVASGIGLADSTISEILAGKRKLSVKQAEALARFFRVKAAVFLNE